jgi:peptidoglycan/xylan/chitin deacetylase (PgdA/CDA1 family)
MTREELFAKREQKLKEQRKRRLIMIGGVIAALLLVFLIVKIATGRVSKKNGPDSSVQTTNEAGVSAATTVSRTTESQTPTPTQAGTDPAAQTADVTAAPAAQTVDETAAADDTAVQGMTEYTEQGAAGWNDGEGGRWYKTASGQQYMNGWKMLDGSRYFFKADGYAAVGWEMADDGNMYYFNEDGTWDSTKKQKLVALTYDDGPSWNTDLILDTLAQYNAKATFFVVGVNQADFYTTELLREYNEGMEIANHTYEHVVLSHSDADTIVHQVSANDELIMSLTGGYQPTLLRAPGGGTNDVVHQYVNKPLIQWDVDTLDWQTRDAANTLAVITENVRDGSVILMHDLYQATAEATVDVVPTLYSMGYKMVTVSELAEAYGYTLENGVEYYSFYPEESPDPAIRAAYGGEG